MQRISTTRSTLTSVPSTGIPWDPSLTTWEQYERYYGAVARGLNKFRVNWRLATTADRDGALTCAEDGLMSAIRTYKPERNNSFEAYAYLSIWADLHRYWNRTVVNRRSVLINGETTGRMHRDAFAIPDPHLSDAELRTLLRSIKSLTDEERKVLTWQYGYSVPLDEIARRYMPDRSRACVGNISRRARRKVADSLAK